MSDSDYPVGRGKPPRHTQFKKGQSGNPAGRPKKSRTLQNEIEDELLSKVTVKENGKSIRVTKGRLLIKAVAAKAISGDVKSATMIVDLMWKLASQQGIDLAATGLAPVAASPPAPQEEDADADAELTDDAILAAFTQRFTRGGDHE